MFCYIKTSTEDFPAMFDSSDERLNHCLMKQAIWEDITFQTHPHIISSGFILFFYRYMPLNITGWWYTYPSEKYEFVSWGCKIPNIWKNKIHVPKHQPDHRISVCSPFWLAKNHTSCCSKSTAHPALLRVEGEAVHRQVKRCKTMGNTAATSWDAPTPCWDEPNTTHLSELLLC
jgi:hypothetical protein